MHTNTYTQYYVILYYKYYTTNRYAHTYKQIHTHNIHTNMHHKQYEYPLTQIHLFIMIYRIN